MFIYVFHGSPQPFKAAHKVLDVGVIGEIGCGVFVRVCAVEVGKLHKGQLPLTFVGFAIGFVQIGCVCGPKKSEESYYSY